MKMGTIRLLWRYDAGACSAQRHDDNAGNTIAVPLVRGGRPTPRRPLLRRPSLLSVGVTRNRFLVTTISYFK
jgi:hypothetical protein